MDFLRKILADQGEGGPSYDVIDQAFKEGREASKEMWKVLMDRAMPMVMKGGNPMGAALTIMVAVWQCLEAAKSAATKTEATHGKEGNPVSAVWEMFEATFLAGSENEATAKLEEIRKRRGL